MGPAFHRGRLYVSLNHGGNGGLLLRIKDWDSHFENHKTRILKHLEFVLVPNKMDGDGYTELVDHPDGAAHYGVWMALLLIASKSTPRGDLARSGGVAHDTASLARVSRLQSAVITPAIARLLKIGWLIDTGGDPAFSGVDAALSGRRIEEKRTELNGREENRMPPAVRSSNPPEEWPNARSFVDAWKRHLKFRRDQPEQVVVQTLIGRNGTVDWHKLVEVHPGFCSYWERRGWDFCPLTLLEWIDMGMPPPPPDAAAGSGPKQSLAEQTSALMRKRISEGRPPL